jgi:hypothetical protein
VVLAVTYTLLEAWIEDDFDEAEEHSQEKHGEGSSLTS